MDINFNHNFGHIEVSITGPSMAEAQVSCRGPQEFVQQIDWARAQSTAGLFAAHTDSPFMAFALAIQMQFAAWSGLRSMRSMADSI